MSTKTAGNNALPKLGQDVETSTSPTIWLQFGVDNS